MDVKVGYICKKYQLKGPSTLLLSSNAFGVAEAILNDEKAKCAYVLGVDQNCPDMEGFFKEKKINVVEAAAAIELGSSKNENTYAELVAWSEGNLGGHPFFEDENIRYEISVHDKRYEAIFYQVPNTTDTLALQNDMKAFALTKYSEEQLANPTPEIQEDIVKMAFDFTMQRMTMKPVWFMISEHYGKYYITMFYDNEYNRANGEDL